jgi:hypothetical protein
MDQTQQDAEPTQMRTPAPWERRIAAEMALRRELGRRIPPFWLEPVVHPGPLGLVVSAW